MKKLLLCALAASCFAGAACATEEENFSITLGGWSHHFDSEYDFNERHNMFVVSDDNFVIGTLINSYSKRAVLAGYNFDYDWGDFRFGVITGGISGYTKEQTGITPVLGVTPMVYPYVEYTRYSVRPVVGVLGNAVTFQIKLQF